MSTPKPSRLTAAQVSAGRTVRICRLKAGSYSAQRLGEMGFQPGELLTVQRVGDPVIVVVRGALLALDRLTAGDIEVEDGLAIID